MCFCGPESRLDVHHSQLMRSGAAIPHGNLHTTSNLSRTLLFLLVPTDLPARSSQLYCERANLLGYDSIQFARPHYACMPDHCPTGARPGYTSELLMCKAGCMTQEVKGACPPGVELRSVDATGNVMSPHHSPCNCSDSSDVLNCGGGTTLYGRPDNGKQKCYARDSGRADEPMVIAIPEIRDIHQWHGCKCDMKNGGKSTAASPVSAVPAAAPTSSPAASPAAPISLGSVANSTAASSTSASSTAASSTAANSTAANSTSASLNDAGSLLQDRAKLEEAEALYHEALAAKQQELGARHPVSTAPNSAAINSTAANSTAADSTVSAAAVAAKPAPEPPNYYLARGVNNEPLLA